MALILKDPNLFVLSFGCGLLNILEVAMRPSFKDEINFIQKDLSPYEVIHVVA